MTFPRFNFLSSHTKVHTERGKLPRSIFVSGAAINRVNFFSRTLLRGVVVRPTPLKAVSSKFTSSFGYLAHGVRYRVSPRGGGKGGGGRTARIPF